MKIQVTKNNLFETWLTWIAPMFKLKYLERKVLAAYLTMHFNNKHRYSNDNVLQELLFSEESTKMMADKLEITVPRLQKTLKALEEKQCIIDNKINPSLINYPKNNKFQIHIDFEIIA